MRQFRRMLRSRALPALMLAGGTGFIAACGGHSPASVPEAVTSRCPHPSFRTSDQYGAWDKGLYSVANNMWNISGESVSQTLSACSHSNWYVTATVGGGSGSVKTYPNAHYNFSIPPKLSSLASVTSTFAETGPGTGTYEDAYDIWLNGIANPAGGSDEVMIWTDNHGQTPAGSAMGTVTLDGRPYTVWKRDGNYFAFVAQSNFTSGTLNLLEFFRLLTGKGWLSPGSVLNQVDYGVELVSTNGVPETFGFSEFSVNHS